MIDPTSLSITFNGNIIEDFRTSIGGSLFSAKFSQKEAIGLFPDAKPGDRPEVTIYAVVIGGDPIDTLYSIEIVGKKEKD